MKRIVVLVVTVALAGCAGFKLGAVCYLPAGMSGQCAIDPPR